MYIPKNFSQHDPNELHSVIRSFPLATLVAVTDAGLEANHIPFVLDERRDKPVLQGHLFSGNPVWKSLQDRPQVLLVFNGPETYISPNYYPTKKDNGKVVPTWNYVAVHVSGTATCIHDDDWKLDMLHKLTSQQESAQPSPWKVSDAPQTYTEKLLAAIVGIEIAIESIEGKWKVSQNQPAVNQQGVVEGLSGEAGSDAKQMAEIVKRYSSDG